MTNDQLLRHIELRLAQGRTADLQQVVYCTHEGPQLHTVQAAAVAAGCVYSTLGPDDDGEATVFVQGSPEELKDCVQRINWALETCGTDGN